MKSSSVIVMLSDSAVTAVRPEAQPLRLARRAFALPDSIFALEHSEELAVTIREVLNELAASETPATLVIPLNWAFTHRLPAGKRLSDEVLAFEFESFLPVALEALTWTFVRRNGKALALAVPTAPMLALLSALEREGVAVAHEFIDVLALGLQAAKSEGTTAILDQRWMRGFTLEDNLPAPFLIGFGEEPPLLNREVRRQGPVKEEAWTILDLRKMAPTPESGRESDESNAAMKRVADAVSRLEEGDLRVGALASRGRWSHVENRAQLALVSAILLLIGVLAGLHVRSRTLNEQRVALEAAQRNVYATVFPVETLPAGAALRLASERKRLEGLTRQGSKTPDSPADAPLDALRAWVAELPADVRIFLENVRLDGNQIALRGKTVEHRDAEKIVEALSKVEGVEARPPRTTRLTDGGVEFSILGKRLGDE
ncbi:MAG: hypothetical protein L6Q93_04165 [Phycisphaerae bacterium]|nr:hypothetical protein [Phycisphaerae bacterium]NUQ08060.1 hypothetical protein [Phycisphaerae bacterium]